MPLFKIGNSLTLGMADPLDIAVIDQIVRAVGMEVEPAICSQTDIDRTLDKSYGTSGTMEEVIQVLDENDDGPEEAVDASQLTEMASDAPIVKLVNIIIAQAVKSGASDVHIEPEERDLLVRYRVDGVMQEAYKHPKRLQNAIVSRLKIMSSLNIAERRVPQDGRIQMVIDKKPIDIRVSSLPTMYGENIVMRILDKSALMLNLHDLGFGDRENDLREILTRPNGVILVTGPTGSGKTATLYSALNEISTVEVNIITLEDPIEYRLPLIRQSQVNKKTGHTFASGLRAILRQDPDILMVGEIRDSETAKTAIEAALTGHLVLSTLHTNDAPGALQRLIEMGVEPFLVSSAVSAVIAQRLVRKICRGCKTEFTPDDSLLESVGLPKGQDITLYRGKGCNGCSGTGYKGRAGIFEILIVNEDLRKLVLENASNDTIRHKAESYGLKSLRQDGLEKAVAGITTVEEVLRVTAALN